MPGPKFTLSMDVGKVNDPSAISIIEELTPEEIENFSERRRKVWTERVRRAVGMTPAFKPPSPLQLRQICRLPTGTKYPQQVAYVKNILCRPPLWGNCEFLLDGTGVGVAVVDMFEEAGLEVISITIHGGTETVQSGANKFRVPKQDLITCTQVAMLQRQIEASAKLTDWEALVKELQDYQVKQSKKTANHDEYNAREGAHDDLVLSLAMGVWRRRPPGGRVMITGLTDLGPRFDEQLRAERAAFEAIGLRHPLDMKADELKAEQAAKQAEQEKHLRLHNPSEEELKIRAALAEAVDKARGE